MIRLAKEEQKREIIRKKSNLKDGNSGREINIGEEDDKVAVGRDSEEKGEKRKQGID